MSTIRGTLHFAFGTDLDQLLHAIEWLKEKGIEPISSFGKEPIEPIVHTWMPAAAVYFNDPDGNSLELMCHIDVPSDHKVNTQKLSFEERENLIAANRTREE